MKYRYKGLWPTILSGSPYVGLQMTFYDLLKRSIPESDSKTFDNVARLLCGALAGIGAQTVTYPGDTVRRRMQINGMGGKERLYKDSWDCTKKLYKNEGFRAFFHGLYANTLRAIPGAAIQFWSYDLLKELLGCDSSSSD